MIIRVFGMGCKKCTETYENVKKALEELEINAEIKKIMDLNEISEWVLMTPAVSFDDDIIFEGKVPSILEVKKELEMYLKR
ncbi:redox-active disulfide protein 2 [Methanococcus vannielii SB]|jgi:small redox-active disulfide protein 2|uniref:Thioredoxin n=1 Tax=Methanococcus vannielii (strain ATCC 35089 / DSM 1224 / JCM 13029 / OCM 148 / SB) TaxID=406327 RepID=A6UQ32_METVS|nr:MTH895/ArsE family thioredoxin-like protein [Methanococcus vannielii]ABR54604.1 redox-active disulfide protein 2 [Methanococcus vannielii SB]